MSGNLGDASGALSSVDLMIALVVGLRSALVAPGRRGWGVGMCNERKMPERWYELPAAKRKSRMRCRCLSR
jgi:hypothetical protein